MILNRIGPFIDPLLRPNQNGFRKGCSTLSQILTIPRIIEGIKETNPPAIINSLTFARHSTLLIDSKCLIYLEHTKKPENTVKVIAITYDNTTAKLVSPDGNTDDFEITRSPTGDTLAPFLLIIIIEYALRKATEDLEDLEFT